MEWGSRWRIVWEVRGGEVKKSKVGEVKWEVRGCYPSNFEIREKGLVGGSHRKLWKPTLEVLLRAGLNQSCARATSFYNIERYSSST